MKNVNEIDLHSQTSLGYVALQSGTELRVLMQWDTQGETARAGRSRTKDCAAGEPETTSHLDAVLFICGHQTTTPAYKT